MIYKLPDYKKGFGGKFGVQEDRKDKSAVGWDEHEKLATHQSQIGQKFFAILKYFKSEFVAELGCIC